MTKVYADGREHTALSPAARKSVFVLERLLEVENAFRDSTTGEVSNKRRRGENGPEAALSPGTLQQDELLRSTIRNILVSTCAGQSLAVRAYTSLTRRNEPPRPSRSACRRRR